VIGNIADYPKLLTKVIMKNSIFPILILLIIGSCKPDNLTPSVNNIFFEVDGVSHQFKDIMVEHSTMYSDNEANWYKVSAYSDIINPTTKRKYYAAFYFEDKGAVIELHAFHFDAIKENYSAYPFHREDDSFKTDLRETTVRFGEKVKCDISATLRYSKTYVVELTNGVCEFDLSTVRLH
jgi:hypothetical protein